MGKMYPKALHQNVKKVEMSISILTSNMGIYQVLEELHRGNWTWTKLPLSVSSTTKTPWNGPASEWSGLEIFTHFPF